MAEMRKPKKPNPRPERRDRSPAAGNKRIAEQTRKILGKHYISKYRVRRPSS